MSEAKNINDAYVTYVNSTQGTYENDVVLNKDMREAGTPLTAGSLILSYHKGGWFVDLCGNYYDRIYLAIRFIIAIRAWARNAETLMPKAM